MPDGDIVHSQLSRLYQQPYRMLCEGKLDRNECAPHNLSGKLRRLQVVLPVRHPELLSAEPFRTKLEHLLEWATGSEWVFDFQTRVAPERFVKQQLVLPIVPQGCEVALWSGGY